MKARLLKQWGGMYAGQILVNVREGDYPAGVAEYFEDDDPAIVEVREPGRPVSHNVTNDQGEVEPLKGSDWAKSQQAKADAVTQEHEDREEAQRQQVADKEASDKKAADEGAATSAKRPKAKRATANVGVTSAKRK